jgi:hypothetical protein
MKEYLKINKSIDSPRVVINYKSGFISIKGKCIPENASSFFKPIIKRLTESQSVNKLKLFKIHLDSYNISSFVSLLEIVRIIIKQKDIKNQLILKWTANFEDLEWIETTNIFKKLTNIRFSYK